MSAPVIDHGVIRGLIDDLPGARMLTLRQPWATAIRDGGKRVENRTWTAKHRGVVLIHAGKGLDGDAGGRNSTLDAALRACLPSWGRRERLAARHLPAGHTSAVLAVARLVDVLDPWDGDLAYVWRDPSQYGWQLDEVVPLDPIPATGALGLYAPGGPLELAVAQQLRARGRAMMPT